MRRRNTQVILWIIFPAFFLAGVWQCGSSAGNDKQEVKEQMDYRAVYDSAHIEFDTLVHDFGSLKEGEQVLYYFVYTNTGKTDLVISEVSSTCGCTIPEWTKKPLAPGESGELKVVFNSDGKSGRQIKPVVVYSNGSVQPVYLAIKAEVF